MLGHFPGTDWAEDVVVAAFTLIVVVSSLGGHPLEECVAVPARRTTGHLLRDGSPTDDLHFCLWLIVQ